MNSRTDRQRGIVTATCHQIIISSFHFSHSTARILEDCWHLSPSSSSCTFTSSSFYYVSFFFFFSFSSSFPHFFFSPFFLLYRIYGRYNQAAVIYVSLLPVGTADTDGFHNVAFDVCSSKYFNALYCCVCLCVQIRNTHFPFQILDLIPSYLIHFLGAHI